MFGLVAAGVVIGFILWRTHALVRALVSPDIARTTLTSSVLAESLHRETGPLIVSVAAAGFVLTFAIPHRPRRARGS
jgi:hypothetical protein